MGWQVERGQNLIKAQNGTWYIYRWRQKRKQQIVSNHDTAAVTLCHTVSHCVTLWHSVSQARMIHGFLTTHDDGSCRGLKWLLVGRWLFSRLQPPIVHLHWIVFRNIVFDIAKLISYRGTILNIIHVSHRDITGISRHGWYRSRPVVVYFSKPVPTFFQGERNCFERGLSREYHTFFLMKIPDTPFNCISWIINTPAQIPDTKYAVKKMGQSKQQVRQPKHPVLYNIDVHCLLSMSQI